MALYQDIEPQSWQVLIFLGQISVFFVIAMRHLPDDPQICQAHIER
jgi:cyanate permease